MEKRKFDSGPEGGYGQMKRGHTGELPHSYHSNNSFSYNSSSYPSHSSPHAHLHAHSPSANLPPGTLIATMEIPSVKANGVIGKAGTSIKAIISASHCQIRVDPDTYQDPRKVYITGMQSGILSAIRLIQRVVVEGPDFLQQPGGTDPVDDAANIVNVSIEIPSSKAAKVIGKAGSAVKTIMDNSNCKVRVEQEIYPPGGMPGGPPNPTRKVFVSGKTEGIVKAIELIVRVVNEGPDFLVDAERFSAIKSGGVAREKDGASGGGGGNGGSTVASPEQFTEDKSVFVPHTKVSELIGARGAVVGEIIKRTNCKVTILQEGVPEGQDRAVSFTGTAENIAAAKVLVLSVIANGPSALGHFTGSSDRGDRGGGMASMAPTSKLGSVETQEEDINPSKVGKIIGAKGSTLKDIMARSGGCKISINQNFPEGAMHKVQYTGNIDQINMAKYFVNVVCEHGPLVLEQIPASYSAQSSAGMGSAAPPPTAPFILLKSQVDRMAANHHFMDSLKMMYQVHVAFEIIPQSARFPDPQLRVILYGAPAQVVTARQAMEQYLGLYSPQGGVGGHTLHATSSASHQQHQHQHSYAASISGPNNVTHVPPASTPGYSLGKDGSAGFLETPISMADGLSLQYADLKDSLCSILLEKNGMNIDFISRKSGARLMFTSPATANRAFKQGFTLIEIAGTSESVNFAAQMIQEVLVNGLAKVSVMGDRHLTIPPNYVPTFIASPAPIYPLSTHSQQQSMAPLSSNYSSGGPHGSGRGGGGRGRY